jgi:acylphosphatase
VAQPFCTLSSTSSSGAGEPMTGHPVMLINVVYVSAATQLFSKEDLVALMQRCSEQNAQRDLTGLLLYKDGNIMQVLEGPAQNVESLFERIKKDPRHKGVMVLIKEPIPARNFPNWGMAFRDLQSRELRAIPAYSEFLNVPLTELSTPAQSRKLLGVFRQMM